MWNNFQDGPPKICDAMTSIRTRNNAVNDTEHSVAGNCNQCTYILQTVSWQQLIRSGSFSASEGRHVCRAVLQGRCQGCKQCFWLPVLSGCQFCSRYADGLTVVPQARHSLSQTVTEQLCIMAYVVNTLRTGSFKLFKRPFPGFLTILTL